MNRRLETIFRKSEKTRINILQMVKPLDPQEFIKGSRGKWSVSEILSHLITAERLSLSYMKKKSLGIDKLENTGLKEELAFIFLKITQRLPLRYKAPAVLQENPPEKFPVEKIIEQWSAVRNDTKTFLETFRDDQIRKKVYKHAFAGRLNIVQAIGFFEEHAMHHLPRIKNLIKSKPN